MGGIREEQKDWDLAIFSCEKSGMVLLSRELMVDPCSEGHKWEVPYIVLQNNMGLTNIRNINKVFHVGR